MISTPNRLCKGRIGHRPSVDDNVNFIPLGTVQFRRRNPPGPLLISWCIGIFLGTTEWNQLFSRCSNQIEQSICSLNSRRCFQNNPPIDTDCESNARVADCLCYDDVNDGRGFCSRALLERESSRNIGEQMQYFDDGPGCHSNRLYGVLCSITHCN